MDNLKACPEGKEINPKTGRCVKKCGSNQERNKDTGKCEKKCPEGKEINPKTGRCVKIAKNKIMKPTIAIELNNKKELIKNFKILEEYENLNKQPFKARAYNKVINSLELHIDKIDNIEDTENIKGICEKIKEKIKQYFQTGKIDAVEKALSDPKFTLRRKLSNLYGVGPVKIKELMEKITSFEDLKNNPEILNEKQKIGLKYYDELLERIPIEEGKKHY